MGILAFALATEQALGSPARGAILAGIVNLSSGLLGPWVGRWFDRRELRRALQVNCLLASGTLAIFAVLVELSAPFILLAFAVGGFGVTVAGMPAGFRALLLVAVDPPFRRIAHFVESLMGELSFGVGPLLVSGLFVLFDLRAVMVAMSASLLAAALVLRDVPPLPASVSASSPRRWPSRAVVRASAVGFTISLGFAMTEGSIPLRMGEIGLPTSSAGPFLVLLSLGSCVGGLMVSFRPLTSFRVRRTFGLLFCTIAATLLPYALSSSALAFALLLPVASLPLVPLAGLSATLVEQAVAGGGRGEAFAWLSAAMTTGGGVGLSLTGIVAARVGPAAPAVLTCSLYGAMGLGLLVSAKFVRRRPPGRGRRSSRGRARTREPRPPA